MSRCNALEADVILRKKEDRLLDSNNFSRIRTPGATSYALA